ncbi:MAG: DUF1232 domain-containing protein [Candidatus Altiarchaeales archaeon]|nr:DUF1232 domain-containing protein [Candidatus Altiarchaeales archaeon]MBD3415931.1 DUF1232 domain-containing protein [Candidatus Altiarchaeales archaeon]
MISKEKVFWLLASLASAAYMLNPGMGVFELIPDNLPVIGNFDEMWAVIILLRSLVELKLVPEDKMNRILNLKKSLSKP